MKKMELKKFIVMNLIVNLSVSVALTITTNYLLHETFSMHSVKMIGISFVLACLINIIIPIPKLAHGVCKIFHVKDISLAGRLLSNFPICLIFVTVIGLFCTAINVKNPNLVIPAFRSTFIAHYIVCYIVSFVVVPIATKVANVGNAANALETN